MIHGSGSRTGDVVDPGVEPNIFQGVSGGGTLAGCHQFGQSQVVVALGAPAVDPHLCSAGNLSFLD